MRGTRTAVVGIVAAAVSLIATACYPPSQNPTDQPIPPGGRVVAVGPVLTEMWIEDATDDLSTILYGRNEFILSLDPLPSRYWVYDDVARTTTEVPNGRAEHGMASLAPDGRSVVFSSNDRNLQVGPTAVNCAYSTSPIQPLTPTVCDELYLFDLDTSQTRPLTGLDGSSDVDHLSPIFTPDGQSIEFEAQSSVFAPPTYHRLDLATGQIDEVERPTPPSSWDRGTHVVEWDAATATLTSTDSTTGVATTLWADAPGYFIARATADGRFIVVSNWVTYRTQVFRLIDTDTGTGRSIPSEWIQEDGSHYAFVQRNVLPDATDRLIIAPRLG